MISAGRVVVDEERLRELVAPGPKNPRLAAMLEAVNPEFRIDETVQIVPFALDIERSGATAGRIYLREQNRLYVVTMSDLAFARMLKSMKREDLA